LAKYVTAKAYEAPRLVLDGFPGPGGGTQCGRYAQPAA
jgi:hypothetical protein